MRVISDTVVCRAEGGIRQRRIPCCVRAPGGDILTAVEARYGRSDWSATAIELWRSSDGGRSFSGPETVCGGPEEGKTYNNPVLIVSGGRVFLLYCREYSVTQFSGAVFCRVSADDGRSWSPAEDISRFTLPEYRNVFATGPTHGATMPDGSLLLPVWLVPRSARREKKSHHPAELRLLHSDPVVSQWFITEKIPEGDCADPNEASAAVLPDGSVYVSVRSAAVNHRCFARLDGSLRPRAPLAICDDMPDPVCCGAALSDNDGGLWLTHCEDRRERVKLTLRHSGDGGLTWPGCITVVPGEAGYSDLCLTNGGMLCVCYETDDCRTVRCALIG